MIIHVVAAEIGEGAGGELDAVEPALVEAMAGRLHRSVGDAGIGKFGEELVKLDRVGRGERAVVVAAWRDDSGGADTGRCVPALLPYLAGEGGDRGLAAGAGDGDHGLGLARKYPGGEFRQSEARVVDEDDGSSGRADRRAFRGDDRRCAAACGIGRIGGAVGLAAGNGDEHHARRDLARIRGHPGDLGSGGHAAFGAKQTGEVVELHLDPVVINRRPIPRPPLRIIDRRRP
jgi:hypothetical protein